MLIELTDDQFKHACSIGEQRQRESLQKNLQDKYGFDGSSGLMVHIQGACGELAAALSLTLPWDATVNTFKSIADLGNNLEVRTRSSDTYDLLVRPDDSDDRYFILVIRKSSKIFDVVGWISGKDAKQQQWLKTHGNRPAAFFVPKNELKNIGFLRQLVLKPDPWLEAPLIAEEEKIFNDCDNDELLPWN